MVFSAGYGFHRDELYFLDCARHLALSYVDQPVFTPLVARLALTLFGVSVVGLRLFAALAAAATVVCGGALAREFGGGSRAQFLSALGCAVSPALIGADHLMGPTAFDILAWTALALVVVRIGRTGNLRLWPVAGLVLGLGLTNKHSIGFFALALLVGTIASGGWRLMANRWFALGALIAGIFTGAGSVVAGPPRLGHHRHDPCPQPGERRAAQRTGLHPVANVHGLAGADSRSGGGAYGSCGGRIAPCGGHWPGRTGSCWCSSCSLPEPSPIT